MDVNRDQRKKITRRGFLAASGKSTLALGMLGMGGGWKRHPWPPEDDLTEDAFWDVVRSQFPLTHERAYFNTGGLGPASYPVLDKVQRTVMDLQYWSEHGHHTIEDTREEVAKFIGAAPYEIAYMRNATEGNSTVASGLNLRSGDEVIFESHAHPGGSTPWMSRQKSQGIKVRIFEPDPNSADGNLTRINDLINDRTRVIQVSHITAPTGILFPVDDIARLAHDKGIWFHIDGAQSAGQIPVNVHAINCDSYATSCHKWMLAPHGTGILYIKAERLDEVMPTEVGAYSDDGYELPDFFAYNPTAQRYEPGTRDSASILGILEAIRFLKRIGMDRVVERGHGLAEYLRAGLREIPGVTVLTPSVPGLSAAMTTFKTDSVPYDDLDKFLSEQYHMRLRIVTERGLDAIRVSTHLFNFREECDRVINGTKSALGLLH